MKMLHIYGTEQQYNIIKSPYPNIFAYISLFGGLMNSCWHTYNIWNSTLIEHAGIKNATSNYLILSTSYWYMQTFSYSYSYKVILWSCLVNLCFIATILYVLIVYIAWVSTFSYSYTGKKLVSPGHQIWCPRFVPIRTPKLVSPVHFNK